MPDATFNVLILCTGNSARSILGEALINHLGAGRFRAFSAGSKPAGRVNPFALEALAAHGIALNDAISDARSKSWDEFAAPGAPNMDCVITVCDSAANEVCPVWPGAPVSAHWGIPDPAHVGETDTEKRAAFELAYARMHRRVSALVALTVETMSPAELKLRLNAIGETRD